MTVRSDSADVNVTNWYNNQGLLIAISNAAGQVSSRTYDIDDRLTTAVDQNGVTTTMTYDNLNRLLTRSYSGRRRGAIRLLRLRFDSIYESTHKYHVLCLQCYAVENGGDECAFKDNPIRLQPGWRPY